MAKQALNLTRVAFLCDPAVLDGLRWLAESRGTTVAELLRGATRQYVVTQLRAEQDDLVVLSGVPKSSDP